MIPITLDHLGSLAVVGIAKNVGKTTLINQISRSVGKTRQLGFVSVGIDGESRDAWSGRPKPAVLVPEGSWIATTRSLIQWEEGCWDDVKGLGSYSLMGELVLAHTTRSIPVKLAGMSHLGDLERVLRLFREKQLLTLVDGAYDRKTFARPALTDGMILVVGGAAGRTESEIIRKANHWLYQVKLPVCVEREKIGMFQRATQERQMWGIRKGKKNRFPFSSLFSSGSGIRDWDVLGIPGALTNKMLHFFIDHACYPTLILSDCTHLFAADYILRTFLRQGGQVEVIHPIRMMGVAINPTNPEGKKFDADRLKGAIGEAAGEAPVWVFEKNPDDGV
ncbi:hypothetical protein [Shimazuella kribbensis]|uniref:lysine 5,6-aminomutase reactivase subunit KamB n=1 Tax=Shimazuella kribbensis TaxID=139808 RepID=UPI000422C138|nr:hypothetical protein [Shimazuella kribbensis]